MSEEIALSIDETNRLRNQLGLKPLRIHDARDNSRNDNDENDVSNRTTKVNYGISESHNNVDGSSSNSGNNNNNKEFLELSVTETNNLREQLGLAPLKLDDEQRTTKNQPLVSESNTVQHVPAINEGERYHVAERIERAKLKRQVETNLQTHFAAPALGIETTTEDGTKSWAQRMRTNKNNNVKHPPNVIKNQSESTLPKGNTHQSTIMTAAASAPLSSYQEKDLHGLHVGHSISELEDGSTTILTLKDAPLLQTADEDTTTHSKNMIIGLNDDTSDTIELQNIQLVQQQQVQDGIRAKRQMELGLGRTGGYVGYDDDEFEELGGTQGPSRLARNNINVTTGPMNTLENTKKKRKKGFQIGAMLDEQDAEMESDIVTAIQKGKAISLTESMTNIDVRPSDYMTPEEYNIAMQEAEQKRLERKSKKAKKSHKVREKKRHKRRTAQDDSDDDNYNDDSNAGTDTKGQEHSSSKDKNINNRSLLDELDATAVDGPDRSSIRKKRNRDDDDDDEENGDDDDGNNVSQGENGIEIVSSTPNATAVAAVASNTESLSSKRERYEQVMAKGNIRSQKVFATTKTTTNINNHHPKSKIDVSQHDDEPDDAFLNAALDKARRLNRLKALASSSSSSASSSNHQVTKGAEAVVAALQQVNGASATVMKDSESSNGTGKTITFKIDETHEFTKTLLARTEQMEREQARLNSKRNNVVIKLEPKVGADDVHSSDIAVAEESKVTISVKEESVDMDVDIHELAKGIKVEDSTQEPYQIGLDGTTTAVPNIGRGVGGLLQLLQQSGGLQHGSTNNNKKKEEMRGRAKDKRTYEDYEPLDLSKVVRIDERNATEKDKELASREVKLEYRDEHGRLLTRKEAFRDLSYQFHGYGSGKRKQEKKLQQIAREQAEARIVSQQLNEGTVHTTFGALKETQRATGKAFVIHKTGN